MHPDAPRLQSARDPEAVAARLVGQHHAIDRPARSASFRLPPLQRAQQTRHVPRIEPPPGTPRNTRHDRADLPRLAAQFHRNHQRAIMIKGGRGVVRIEMLRHRIAPFSRSWTTERIPDVAVAHPHSILTLRDSHISLRSEEHTSELQSLMRISYAVFCLKKKNNQN